MRPTMHLPDRVRHSSPGLMKYVGGRNDGLKAPIPAQRALHHCRLFRQLISSSLPAGLHGQSEFQTRTERAQTKKDHRMKIASQSGIANRSNETPRAP